MKKIFLFIVVMFGGLYMWSQPYKSMFSSKDARFKMKIAEMNLRRANVLNKNMSLIPVYKANTDVVYKSKSEMEPDFIKNSAFLWELDSISKANNIDPFLLSFLIIVSDKSSDDVYMATGDLRFPSPNYGMNKKRDFGLREVMYGQEEISRFIAKLYISNSLDYIFFYPTHWDDERVWVYGIYFAIKDDRVYIISDFSQCPALYPIEQFVDVYWKELTGE